MNKLTEYVEQFTRMIFSSLIIFGRKAIIMSWRRILILLFSDERILIKDLFRSYKAEAIALYIQFQTTFDLSYRQMIAY